MNLLPPSRSRPLARLASGSARRRLRSLVRSSALPVLGLVGLTPAARAQWTVSFSGHYSLVSGTASIGDTAVPPGGGYTQYGGSVTANDPILGYNGSNIGYSLYDGAFSSSTLTLGFATTGSGSFLHAGGTVNVSSNLLIANGSSSTGRYNLAGGTLNAQRVTFSGTSINNSRFDLNGGTLVSSSITASSSRQGLFYFNGGTLRANPGVGSPATGWLNSGLTAQVSTRGAVIDTAGTDRSIYAALQHDPELGAGLDGGLTKLGAGTLKLFNTLHYTGTTTVEAGTLLFNGDPENAALPMTSVRAYAGPLVVNGGTLGIPAASETVGSLSGVGGSVNLYHNTLTVIQTTDAAYLGSIGGTGALHKTGSSTLTLSGANTYSGGTTLAAGALAISSLANLGAGPVNFSGGTLRIHGSALADLDALSLNTTTFNGGLHIADAAHSVTLSQSLSGSGALRKTGAGTLVLTGANTFTGGIALDAGTLSVSSGAQLGSATNALAFNGGVLRVSGTSLQNLGAHTLNTTTFHGGFDIADAANTFTVGHSLSGSGALTKRGAGTLALSGSNTFTGGLQLREGLVEFSTLANLGGGTVTLDGGGLRWAAGNTVDITAASNLSRTIGAGGATFDTHGNNVAFSAAFSGSGALVKSGAGTLTLSTVNTHTGGTVVNGGNLVLAAGGQVGALRGALTINPGATVTTSANNALGWGAGTKIDSLTINGGTLNNTAANSHGFGIAYTLTGATMMSNSGLSNPAAASHFSVDGASSFNVTGATPSSIQGRLDLRGDGGYPSVNFTVADGSRLNITAGVSSAGPVGIVKQGPGVLALTGANTYTGNTTVNGGLVEFNSASALGASNRVILNGGGLRWASGTATDISSRLDPLGANGGTIDTNGNNVAFATALSGSGSLVKSGAGTLTLSGANTYSGGTVVNGGTLAAGHVSAFGAGTVRINAGTVDFGGHAIGNALDIRGGSLAGLAAFSGTQTVSGASSYTGSIGGSLLVASGGAVDTTGAIFTGATTVQSGGTLKGTGTLASLTVQSGGTLAPGNSPGLLTIDGPLTLDSGSFTTLEIAGLTRGATNGYDAIDVGGALTAGGTLTVSFFGGYTPSGPATFDLFNFTSFGGSFAQVNLPTVGGYTWNTSQLSLDGTLSLVVSAIPEPSAFATLAGAVALAGVGARRGRRRAVGF